MDGDRPTVVIAENDASVAARSIRRDAIALVDLPAEPFALAARGLLAYAAVRNRDDCEAVLVALTRGVDLVVTLEITGSPGSTFVDDLARIADVSTRDSNPLRLLSADQVELLEALAAGRTLTDVARSTGMSRRTATRRLADARAILGADTTIEAIRRFEQLRP
jgi:DNA-binding CsgD family transcriptional regulator